MYLLVRSFRPAGEMYSLKFLPVVSAGDTVGGADLHGSGVR